MPLTEHDVHPELLFNSSSSLCIRDYRWWQFYKPIYHLLKILKISFGPSQLRFPEILQTCFTCKKTICLGQYQHSNNDTTFDQTEINNKRQTLVKIWNISTILGVIGTVLNGMILINFYIERNALFTVVNVMIW